MRTDRATVSVLGLPLAMFLLAGRATVGEGWYVAPEELTTDALEPYIVGLFLG